MSIRHLTKVPKLCLVYFSIDKSTWVVETKKLRNKETGEPFTDNGPEKRAAVAVKNGGKCLEAMVIALDDNKEELNEEETKFVEDPANAGLFDDPPSTKKKRTRDDQPSPDNSVAPTKRGKPSGDAELQMLNMFLAEQAQKQARLKLQRVEKNRQTEDIAIQCERSPQTVEVAVQTDIPDIMEELRDQVKSLTKIVAELTEMKAREKVTSLLLLSDSDLTFVNEHDDVVEETPPQAPPAAITSAIIVPEPQVPQPLSAPSSLPTYPPPQMRSPLSTIDSNSPIFCSIPSLGPSDQQRQKVEAVVVLGKEMVSSAMACIDVLFSDEELANSNTSGSNRYRELDNLKIRFLMSVLRQKYESPLFMKQWEDVK
ncbi:hypothetical protein P5673_028528 [Acropora cervicornis]|uniref:BEN domain-containing protein n=1 Tax=Acropora cervicornis TaxID=6130 RepID=A0AAD9PX25_ACRCE|nr:hypothetical protein P5673_028528 [Acropora cervicornis]